MVYPDIEFSFDGFFFWGFAIDGHSTEYPFLREVSTSQTYRFEDGR